jgi:hypothetical protein
MQIKTTAASWSILFILPLSYAAINYIFDPTMYHNISCAASIAL